MSDEQEEELVIVGEEGIEDETPAEDEDKEEISAGEDEDEEKEDTRLGAGEEEDEEEDQKERRKRENRERRQRRQEAKHRTQTELRFLRKRNADLERRFSQMENRVGQTETASVDTKISQLESQVESATDIMTKALEAQKTEDFVEAQDIRDKLRDQITQLKMYKQAVSQRPPSTEQSERPDPRTQRHAEQWMMDNEWWDPEGGDPDSKQVLAIDSQLVNEGYDPKSKAYWSELTNRVKKSLPHQFEEEDSPPARKKTTRKSGGPKFRTGGRDRPLKKNEVYISPERKQALIDAGAWDDPQLRQKYLRSYAKYDRENQSA